LAKKETVRERWEALLLRVALKISWKERLQSFCLLSYSADSCTVPVAADAVGPGAAAVAPATVG
jgi:hypothetical protein